MRTLATPLLMLMLSLACERPSGAVEPEGSLAARDAPGIEDDDGDGIVGTDERCPGEPGLAPDGCPIRDRDQDGVLDPDDACPDEPECANGFDDDDGCPDGLPEDLAGIFGAIDDLDFAPNKWALNRKSHARLDAIAEVMLRYPEIEWEIAGHTNERADAATRRQSPTRKRAEAVRDYLIQKGVDPVKLDAKGYGEEMPIASNKTIQGRAQNRRVELHPLRERELLERAECGPPDEASAP